MKEKIYKLETIIKELDSRVTDLNSRIMDELIDRDTIGDKIKRIERNLDQDDERIDELTKNLREGFMYITEFESKVKNAFKQKLGVVLDDDPNEKIPVQIV